MTAKYSLAEYGLMIRAATEQLRAAEANRAGVINAALADGYTRQEIATFFLTGLSPVEDDAWTHEEFPDSSWWTATVDGQDWTVVCMYETEYMVFRGEPGMLAAYRTDNLAGAKRYAETNGEGQ